MQRDDRNVTLEVTADGEGLVSHAGSALLAQIADKSGLTQALSLRLASLKQRRSGAAVVLGRPRPDTHDAGSELPKPRLNAA
jgi:hypothetical protein